MPDVIISTGVGVVYPTCNLLGKKVIFLESFAWPKNKTKTGELIYPIADYFIVQWGRNAETLSQSIVSWQSLFNCLFL
jgi:hypothetical protein